MATATVTSKGQITLPKVVRDRLGVGAGDKVEFVETAPGTFRLIAATRDVRTLKGLIPKPAKPVTVEDMSRCAKSFGYKAARKP
ncbi:MAG TPA: AbrB/MazE/SpoVT family DNA-binding domain-containing protein [Gammaproteobacteria bacterium]|nr:AbrB/MazE/SpoVT family DNA-binding domain-containing protein [Gammaproteobacteria bacterium]